MNGTLVWTCLAIVGPLLSAPSLHAEVTADPSGHTVFVSRDTSSRVVRETVLKGDGSRHSTFNQYWPQSEVKRRTADEDTDRSGRPIQRVFQDFDVRGRLIERRAVTIDSTGHQTGTRTHYSYDAQGRVHETTSPLTR